MAGRRRPQFTPNKAWFDTVLRRPDVEQKVDEVEAGVRAAAQASAPVDSGNYRQGIVRRVRQAKYRRVVETVATDPKSLIIESRTGNMARAAKAGKR